MLQFLTYDMKKKKKKKSPQVPTLQTPTDGTRIETLKCLEQKFHLD